jgi:hypothetical protein
MAGAGGGGAAAGGGAAGGGAAGGAAVGGAAAGAGIAGIGAAAIVALKMYEAQQAPSFTLKRKEEEIQQAYREWTKGSGLDPTRLTKFQKQTAVNWWFNQPAQLAYIKGIRESVLGSYQSGGIVPMTGPAVVHEGEGVFTTEQMAHLAPVDIRDELREGFSRVISAIEKSGESVVLQIEGYAFGNLVAKAIKTDSEVINSMRSVTHSR